MTPTVARVVDRVVEGPGTVTLAIELSDALTAPAPGQFNMLWAYGVGEVPISLCAVPPLTNVILHTIHDVGAVSHALCELRPGDQLGVRGPFGIGWDLTPARGRDVVVMAGGIGLAPLRPVVEALLADREAYGQVAVLLGARTPNDLLFPAETAAWSLSLQVETTVDRSAPGWTGDVGVVTTLLGRIRHNLTDAVAFVCGPEVMMRFGARALLDRGVSAEGIQVSMERNMQCAVTMCGHCQFGQLFVCSDGPVFPWARVESMLGVREL
ncbi:MAG: FAD/NAD(P)-binding protein [Actinomycetes bacterium]